MRPSTHDAALMEAWIHEAFRRRTIDPPPAIGALHANNHRGDRWFP